MSLTDFICKLRSRTGREFMLAAEAFLFLGLFRAAILLFPFRRITALMGLKQGVASSKTAAVKSLNPADIGWAVQAAAVRTPWESACLAQALTGMAMLGRRGINATLYLGVAKGENVEEVLAAHAWLRCDDAILTGAGGVDRYTAISSFSCLAADDAARPGENYREIR